MTTTGPQTVVIALGNPLRGDDGVASAVLERLRVMALPGDVALLDGGTAGLETALLLDGYDRAIIIDAAEMGAPAGTVRSFSAQWVLKHHSNPALLGSLHSAALPEALRLADTLGILPDEVTIVGVQPALIGWTQGLSAAVDSAIPAACDAVLAQLQPITQGDTHVAYSCD